MIADKFLKAEGMACTTLTPEISKAIREMDESQILEVVNDDPASLSGVSAWCRITGHELVSTEEAGENKKRYFIKKKKSKN